MGKYVKKYLKLIIMACVGLLLILSGLLSWNLYFSKFQIFYEQEEMFLETVKRYYSMNSNHLPKTGESREITLQFLYDGNHIDDLVIPKTNKLCDNDSWVRVYKDETGEYNYVVYLKCGKYESSVDSKGPEIVLNGEDEIVLSLGSKYEELGVKSVTDVVDNNINIDDVKVDSSNVDTGKVGSYEVTYTVKDKNYNKTVKIRKVTVARSLTEVVKKATDKTNYYRGNNVGNNYILFSGMLFRIVKVNSDGTVMIISDESVTNLRINYDEYKDSNVDIWLNNVYYKALNDANKYLVDGKYCVGKINSSYDYNDECSKIITSKIGLLSISDYMKTLVNNDTYLDNGSYYALANKIDNNYAVVPVLEETKYGLSDDIIAGIRPVLYLKKDLHIMSGDGTSSNPYKLDDYSYGKKNEKISTRLVGEYLEYSGLIFRIIGIDSNNNVRLIMDQPWTVQPYNNDLKLSVANLKNLEFNLKDKNNPGYILNNDYTDYISTKYIIDTNYEIPINDPSLTYNNYKTKTVKAKILLPKTYELFSTIGNNELSRKTGFMYIDKSVSNNMIFMSNGNNGLMYEFSKDTFYSYSIKIVITIKGDLKIVGGKGIVNYPYVVR